MPTPSRRLILTELRAVAPEALVRRVGELASGDEQARALADALLHPLEREDAERGSDLTTTLRAYYDCELRVDRTAERLFLHRNSVRYRLDRIRALTGMTLEEPTVVAAFAVAFACATASSAQLSEGRHAG
jgi:DNA-binding PucR family transcriptional regulator